MDTVIRTWGLAKSYRSRPALRGIDLEVPRNVVFGYLGANGAGKTTTIRLLAGLLRPATGRAEVLGLDTVRDREAAQRHIGYLPGAFVGYPDLTGEQYLRYIGNLRGGIDWSVADRIAKRLDLDLTGTGFMNAELFSAMLPVLFIIFAVGRGARMIGGEEEAARSRSCSSRRSPQYA